MKRYFVTLSLWLLTSIPAVAIADVKMLRVAVSSDNPPLAYVVGGKAVGIEVDLSRLLQAELGVPLQLQSMPAAEVVPALERGEIDIAMAGLVITPELERRVEFVQSYLRSGEMAIIRTDDIMRFRSSAALLQDGIKVGSVAGSAGADYVKATMNHPVPTSCTTADECLHALLAKRIDLFIGAPATSWRLATDREYGALMSLYRPLTEEYFAWAVAKNNTQLSERLGAALQRMRQTQMFEHILSRWIPVRVGDD